MQTFGSFMWKPAAVKRRKDPQNILKPARRNGAGGGI